MSFPACRHAKRKSRRIVSPLIWLGSEPYRIFFLSGILFSIAGVLMWPLFYKGHLSFYPGISHARVMIEAFGGAFVVGFLGTAGPRMLGAPRLKPWELVPLFSLHLASGICHLKGLTIWGDGLFLALLLGPVMGVGIFLFPRLLGNAFGEPEPGEETQKSWRNMSLAAVALVASFAVELWLNPSAGIVLRVAAFLAALTRLSADFLPRVTISHYEYAAWSWAGGALLWAIWHAPRFFKKDDEE